MFDGTTFATGILLGMILMYILIWILYSTRTFIFSYCASGTRPCAGADYYNDPGKALAEDSQLDPSQILFLNDEGELYYKRVPFSSDCVPESNQLMYIRNPQYCLFETSSGATGVWKQIQFGSNTYQAVGGTAMAKSDANCQPNPGQTVTSGSTLLRWNAN